jgi:5-methylcytosine-specific restriction endonuclease McrA
MADQLRTCLRDPIPEIADAARYLDAAVVAHLAGNRKVAEELIRLADIPIIREWSESLWGANSPYNQGQRMPEVAPILEKNNRVPVRMPNKAERQELRDRDGFHCRFCGIPVIRKEIRTAIHQEYPDSAPWGSKNSEQHAGLQAMWLQYDHVLPHARGGTNDLGNIVITCGPCNFGRGDHLIEEMGVSNPFDRDPIQSSWDGLERFLTASIT